MSVEISNRLPDTDTIPWEAVIMCDGEEETFYLDLDPFLDMTEVTEAFINEANDTYALDYYPQILLLRSSLGEFS